MLVKEQVSISKAHTASATSSAKASPGKLNKLWYL